MTRPSPLDRPVVLGLDPSLTGYGYAWTPTRCGTLRSGGHGLPRLRWLRDAVRGLVLHLRAAGPVHLVVIEGMFPSTDTYVHERAALYWWTLDVLDDLGVPVAVAPPAQVKMLATGNGSSATSKAHVVAAARNHLGYRGTGHVKKDTNEADALWLAELGYQRLGRPTVHLPQQHTRALTSVAWPPGL